MPRLVHHVHSGGAANSARGCPWVVRKLILALGIALLTTLLPVHGAPEDSVSSTRDIPYAKVGTTTLRLDLSLPANLGKPVPVLVWIHGGSWQYGSRQFPYAQFFTEAGYAVASIDYRLSGQAAFPAQIFDCKAAIRWLRANAGIYHLDPERIVAIGGSAGGHLAALLGTTPDDPRYEGSEGNPGVSSRIQAVCDFSGPTDLLSIRGQYLHLPTTNRKDALEAFLGGTVEARADLARLASPALQVSAKACPFFIAHGDRDPVVPVKQSQELYDALIKAGVPATLRIVRGGGHGLTDPLVYAEALAFVQRQLGP